jgi:uncharacterized membrane protein (DUF106 family)
VSGTPLPEADASAAPATSSDASEAAPATPARPAAPQFKLSTFVFTFLFILGLLMLFDAPERYAVANFLGLGLKPLIGFGGKYLLLTMFLAAVIEMLATALAYNWATDWVKAAKVGKWNAAFRKVQMEALRSGKKDRIEALKPHQQRLTLLSSEVSFAQLKGMAITWFLVIAIYTWVYLFIVQVNGSTGPHGAAVVSLGGSPVNLLAPLGGISFIPLWFVIFSLYTIPASIALRRVLKHYWLRRYAAQLPPSGSGPGAVGGAV